MAYKVMIFGAEVKVFYIGHMAVLIYYLYFILIYLYVAVPRALFLTNKSKNSQTSIVFEPTPLELLGLCRTNEPPRDPNKLKVPFLFIVFHNYKNNTCKQVKR